MIRGQLDNAARVRPAPRYFLFDPTKDRSFMRAVREKRVLSVRQEPTSKRQDFGVVGFDPKPHTAYLIFPRPLTAFADARIVGIKYDVLSSSPVVASSAPRSLPKPKARAMKAGPTPEPVRVSKPPKRIEPQPKRFRVRVRVITATEKDVTVEAMTKGEAKKIAQAEFSGEGEARAVSVSAV